MKVIFSVPTKETGEFSRKTISLKMDAVPRIGEPVRFTGLTMDKSYVTKVVWFPDGDDQDPPLIEEPFVYISLGEKPKK